MTSEDARRVALTLPEVVEAGHQELLDFRVRGRVFAALRPEERRVLVKLTRQQQVRLAQTKPGVFAPLTGAWGQWGWTNLCLKQADEATLKGALLSAYRNVTPKSLAARLCSGWARER